MKGKLKVFEAAWEHKYDKGPLKIGPLLEVKIDIGWTNADLCYCHFAGAYITRESKDSTGGAGLEVEVAAELGSTTIVMLPLRGGKALPLEVYSEFVEVDADAELVEITSSAWRESAEDAEYNKYLAQAAAVMETIETSLAQGAMYVVESRYLDPVRKDMAPGYMVVDGDYSMQELLESVSLKNGVDWFVDPVSGDLAAKTHGAIYPIEDGWAETAEKVTIREIVDDADKECVRDIVDNAESVDEIAAVAKSMFEACGKTSSLVANVQHAVAAVAA